MADLNGSSQPIVLGNNFRLRAPGVFGEANLARRNMTGTTRSTTAAAERAPLDRALASQEMMDIATIDVTIKRRQPPTAGAVLRAPSGDDAMELEVPAPPPGHDALVISVDEAGGITWNFPLNDRGAPAPAANRGAGQTLRFRIPNKPAVVPPPGAATTRSLFGVVGKKILKVLIYPITDRLVGPLVDHFAEKWEGNNRPYRIRMMTPDNYSASDAAAIEPGGSEFQKLQEGRSLLFIHGTFSSAHSAFAGLTRDDLSTLSQAYGGRLYAFDHFTLSHSPERNIAEFVSRLPQGVRFASDVVCHSRGGLVARELVERKAVHGLENRLDIGKVVFVGAANAGTILAEPDHMVHMIDRFTSAINLLPDGPAAWLLESVITAVKVVGHGGLKSLEGLASMNPNGAYLSGLSAASTGRARYFGITADFEPSGTPLSALTLGDAAMDRIFQQSENDLVVPTAGVYEGGGPSFPIVADDLLSLPASAGVIHTSYFSNKDVQARIRQWLTG
jgi:hypothetical protein